MPRRELVNSTRSRPRLSSLADLITHSENTIASSQATVYTANSQRTSNTQSREAWADLQNYDDIMNDEAQNLRITPQEERRIQSILELARKGKINPGNAFEIPIKVANSQVGEGQNMRFWKFASQLLAASMGIYDKRVEHVYLGTNRMFQSLVRVGTNNQPEDEPEERNRKQRGAILKMDLSELGSTEAVASYDFGKFHCQEPEKVNIKKNFLQFNTDPMFNKRLKAFDSDSLKCLFLNVFETSLNHEVKFFHNDDNSQPSLSRPSQHIPQYPSNQIFSSENSDDDESTKTCCPAQIPRFISQDFKKMNFIAQNNDMFSNISHFKKETQREGILESTNLLTNIQLDFDLNDHSQINNISRDPEQGPLQVSGQFEHSNFSMGQDYTQFSEDLPHRSNDEESIQHPVSERYSPQLFLSASSRESTSNMTPWELEFKGMKLQKKKTKRGKREQKEQRNKQPDEYQINFLDMEKPSRDKVFSRKVETEPPSKKYIEKNLLPLNVDPFLRVFAQLPMTTTASRASHNERFLPPNRESSHEVESFNLQSDRMGEAIDEMPFVSNSSSQTFWGTQSERPSSHSNNNPLKNIREIKQRLHHRLQQIGQVKLSQIDIGLNFSSIMVVVLHLANQLKLEIIEAEDDDVLIKAIY